MKFNSDIPCQSKQRMLVNDTGHEAGNLVDFRFFDADYVSMGLCEWNGVLNRNRVCISYKRTGRESR